MVAAVARGEREPLLNIGQVLDRLRSDFEDISIPKIRFLESEGLVKPERTPAGYRKFSEADIVRLRYILRMQRDHYLPLKVIGEHLDAMDRGLEPPAVEPVVPTVPKVAVGADGLPAPESFRRTDRLRLSRKELIKVAEIDQALLAQLEDFALISPSATGHYDTDALVIAQTAKELADFGIEPRHLRAFRTAADREVGLIQQVVAPRRGRDAGASARAEEAVSEIAALSVRLHATLVKAGLRRI
ncbi:MerR family transcriptional regulator [Nocardioides sp. Root190]|uniref:transcriptional regulator FtsR n=1 Tax=Nocardioides sp. Root190 TaxID=1736488 RepID=UPI0006FA50C0|nr:MerR family transcriptional regulator [Nocardioides sp. Root190]KRB73837.1 MerR family transcriptional regulator [Nocardioides sp. Root190]